MRSVVRISKQTLSFVCIVGLLAVCFLPTFAQKPTTQTKRPLTHQDYDSWRSIQAPQISRDGKFVAYAYMAQDADSDVVVRNIVSGTEWRAPRGYRPPAPPPDDSLPNFGEIIAAQARLARPLFTADSRYVFFSIEPTKAEVIKAKKDQKKPEDMPKNALGIMNLSSGQVTRVERVKNFQVPEDGSGFIAYLLEPKPDQKKAEGSGTTTTSGGGNPTVREGATSPEVSPPQKAASSSTGGSGNPTVREGAKGTPSSKEKKKEYGSDLVLRNTVTGAERIFNDVLDYSLSKDAKTLVYTAASKKEETNGVYVVTPQSDGAPVSLLAGKGKYQKLAWDEDQTEVAFISDRDNAEAAKVQSLPLGARDQRGCQGKLRSQSRDDRFQCGF